MGKKVQENRHGIITNKNRAGDVISYKLRCCVGRDEQYRQVWRTTTIQKDDPRIDGLTPAKLKKELESIKHEWDKQQKAEYEKTHAKIDKKKITLVDFVNEHWWPDHVMDGQHKPTTISFYEHMSGDILAYFGPKKKLRQIDAEAVKRYIKWLRTEARTKPPKAKKGEPTPQGRPLSAASVQHHFSTLRNILEYARRYHYIEADPCQDLAQKEKPKREKRKVDFLTPKEAREYMKCLEDEPLYWRCLENLYLTTGMRRGECIGLQREDLDSEALVLTVHRNVTVDKNSPTKYHVGTTKGDEARKVPLVDRVFHLLQALFREQDEVYGVLLPTAYIFHAPGDPYRPLYPTEPTRWQRKFVEKNHLHKVSPHDLRHTAATLALEGGANLKQVQELLGHKDPATTMAFYAGLTDEAQRRTVEGIESQLG